MVDVNYKLHGKACCLISVFSRNSVLFGDYESKLMETFAVIVVNCDGGMHDA
jgi:hypothetical protein